MNARLSATLRAQWIADERAARDKRALLAPDRPRLLPRWFWPLVCIVLAACAWPVLWRIYGTAMILTGFNLAVLELSAACDQAPQR